jgi:hypothetical protein
MVLAATAIQGQNGFVRVKPEDVKWVVEPDGTGIQRATIEGDPTRPGLYVVRIKFPRGMMSTNHFHREDRHAVVLQGTWYTGTGTEFAPDRTVGLGPGSYMKHPAGQAHFDGARDEEVILQIVGMGPTSTTRIRPGDPNFAPSIGR